MSQAPRLPRVAAEHLGCIQPITSQQLFEFPRLIFVFNSIFSTIALMGSLNHLPLRAHVYTRVPLCIPNLQPRPCLKDVPLSARSLEH